MARKEKTIHYIYKTICNVTQRYYIGMHSTSKLDDGYMGSGLRLRRSIRKYGKENHTKEILEYLETREELVLREIEIVNKELIEDDLCMNLKGGGEGGLANEEHYKKFIGAGINNFNNSIDKRKETINKVRKTKEYRDKLSESKIEYFKTHDGGFVNKKHSDETKELISKKMKILGNGINNSQYGTCWITNEIDNKKILKGDEIPEGWKLGRKIKL